MTNNDRDQPGAGSAIYAYAMAERDFYTARFDKGQQRGLAVVTSSAGLVALLAAGAAFLPQNHELQVPSLVLIGFASLALIAASGIAISSTGPPWTVDDAIETEDVVKQSAHGQVTADACKAALGTLLFTQAGGIRRVGNRQAKRVMLAMRVQVVAVALLAAGVVSIGLDL